MGEREAPALSVTNAPLTTIAFSEPGLSRGTVIPSSSSKHINHDVPGCHLLVRRVLGLSHECGSSSKTLHNVGCLKDTCTRRRPRSTARTLAKVIRVIERVESPRERFTRGREARDGSLY